ncbi:FAD-binding oxidoreductase [Roseinatronobacter alkalisoli]|uniref:FAD-binding oxidoreductase n=1 Tax=Roseinatronobacter alkalisoli TaxID=3028235 RepID=A0ABT5TCW1_9RHOB|nr:FAD-binding oxidoreductase [Roseinatronobacter sp. HJB301]MDD7972939.1 FAD-binding oxidoreductase [Roseinatronobacter sp. HJB301]
MNVRYDTIPSLQAFLDALPEAVRSTRIDPVPPRNHNDWSALMPEAPAALFCPRTTEDIAVLLRAANTHRISVVPQGGLTGLCGGARPVSSGIALSLEKMVGIEEIDPASATITVLAGTPLEVVQNAAAEAGLYFPLDLGARGSCTIGGNASTNAGGNRVIRYGLMRDLVLGLEAVLSNGTVIDATTKLIKNNTGYDLRQLFLGSEGTLGIITRLVLRLQPAPGCTHAALCGMGDYASVLRLLDGARRKLGPTLSAFEVMWPDYWQIACDVPGVRSPLTQQHVFRVLIEAQGTNEAIDSARFTTFLEEMFDDGVLEDAVLSQSLSDIKTFWGVRDACSEFKVTLGPHLAYDVGLPTRQADEFAKACAAAITQAVPGGKSVFYGHVADGNLHLLAWLPGAKYQPAKAFDTAVYSTVREFGGSVSAEHGIGTTKKPYLEHSRTAQEIALMRLIKTALDPNGILNPGKVIDL